MRETKELSWNFCSTGEESAIQNSLYTVFIKTFFSAYENLLSTAERRRIINNETETHLRLRDLYGVIPSITGKIELVYEGEQEGPAKVAQILIGKAFRNNFTKYFPTPDNLKKTQQPSPYQPIIDWCKKGNKADLMMNLTDKQYRELLQNIPQLENVVKKFQPSANGQIQDFY